jgi:hypothetical protein
MKYLNFPTKQFNLFLLKLTISQKYPLLAILWAIGILIMLRGDEGRKEKWRQI